MVDTYTNAAHLLWGGEVLRLLRLLQQGGEIDGNRLPLFVAGVALLAAGHGGGGLGGLHVRVHGRGGKRRDHVVKHGLEGAVGTGGVGGGHGGRLAVGHVKRGLRWVECDGADWLLG